MSALAHEVLLDLLTDSGVHVLIDAEDLCVRAPRGVLSDDDWVVIGESKGGLVDLIKRRETPINTIPSYGWREQIASWPDAWREKWGWLSNQLEEQSNLGWRDAEEKAFAEVSVQKAEAESAPPWKRAS